MISHIPRKRFGQHFLHDRNIIQKIVHVINPQPKQHIVEIGPGLGALTTQLLPLAKKLTVIELDRDVIPVLESNCRGLGELDIISADVLTINFHELAIRNNKLRIVGNLPYNITTPLLFHLFDYVDIIQDMYFMVQKEVAERMAAKPGSDAYGRLSIMLQYFVQAKILFRVSPGSFQPPPKVDSAVVELIPHETKPFLAKDYKLFQEIVRDAFNQRRKTIRNSLSNYVDKVDWTKINIGLNKRAEQLSLEDYVNIANACMA